MTSSRASTYDLVPAVPPLWGRFAPTFYFPAIPVRLGPEWSQVVYARIDVGLPISQMDTSLSHHLMTTGFASYGATRAANVTVLRADHSPWLMVGTVPFEVVQHFGEHRSHPVTLGFESFLAYLRITFNFPKRSFTITAPQRLILPLRSESQVPMPDSVLEAERLIAAGSYSSGVASLLTGLMEALPSSSFGVSSSSASYLSSIVASSTGDPALGDLATRIADLRNRAVHGGEGEQPSEAEARTALKATKKVINALRRSA